MRVTADGRPHDDGRSWTRLRAPPCTGKYAFAGLDRSTTGRAPKLTNLVVYRTTNGGQSWQTYPVGL